MTIASPGRGKALGATARDGRLRALALRRRGWRLGARPAGRADARREAAASDEDVLASTYFASRAAGRDAARIVERLHRGDEGALAAPDVADRLSKAGLNRSAAGTQELADTVRRDIPRFREIIRTSASSPAVRASITLRRNRRG